MEIVNESLIVLEEGVEMDVAGPMACCYNTYADLF